MESEIGKMKSRDKRLLVGANMPPLQRTQPGGKYNYKNDEVLKWISERPGLLLYVLDKLAHGGYIEYDSSTGLWKGVDYDED